MVTRQQTAVLSDQLSCLFFAHPSSQELKQAHVVSLLYPPNSPVE